MMLTHATPRRAALLVAALTVCLIGASAQADGLHEGDFVLTYDEAAGSMTIAPPVKTGVFGDSGWPNYTADPGIDSVIGELPAGESIAFDVLGPVRKWDGSTFDAIAQETITIGYGPASVTTSPHGPVTGFAINASSSGEFHVHYDFTLNDPAEAGIYLLDMELYFQDTEETRSNPFYFVFSQDGSQADLDEAVYYVENVIVPEPGTAALLIGAGTLLLRRRSRRGRGS